MISTQARGTGLVRVAFAAPGGARRAYYFKIPTPDHHDVVADIVATIEERQPESGGGDQSNPLQVTPDFRLPTGVRATRANGTVLRGSPASPIRLGGL